MTSIDLATKVKTDGIQVFRPRKDAPGHYDAKGYFTGSRRGWVALDAFSASAILAIYNALGTPELKEKYASWTPQKQASFAMKHVK